MTVGSRNRRGAPSMSFALAALAIGANAALAGALPIAARFAVAPETPPSFGGVAGGPLLDALFAPRAAERDRRGLGPFGRLAPSDGDAPVVAPASAAEGPAEAPLPPSVPTRSASPAPDPQPTALAAALAGLIMRNGVNPLGDGDWRAARAASADHWSGQAIGRSISRLTPKPRGSRPSIAALARAGDRKARHRLLEDHRGGGAAHIAHLGGADHPAVRQARIVKS